MNDRTPGHGHAGVTPARASHRAARNDEDLAPREGASPTGAETARRRSRFEVACLGLLAALAVLYTLSVAATIILPLLLALVLSLLLAPAKRLLTERLRLPAPLVSLLLILGLFAAVAGIGVSLTLPASNWLARLPQSIDALQHKLGFIGPVLSFLRRGMERMSSLLQGGQAAGAPSAPATPPAAAPAASLGDVGLLVLEGTRDALGQLLTLLVTLFFTLAYGDSLLRRVVEVMPTFGEKRQVVEIATAIERNISSYLLTITVMNLFTGTCNFLSMWLLGYPDPLLWGTLAFLLNYIPILGPFTGVVLFFLVGLLEQSSLGAALLPPAIYLGVHVLEGESLTPMLLARRFTLNPLLVIVSLFFWDWMWGVVGAFLSVPLLAITKIVCDHVPSLAPLGHVLGAPRGRGERG